jgi:hypothetical protein
VPDMPRKELKLIANHMDPVFIEERRVRLELFMVQSAVHTVYSILHFLTPLSPPSHRLVLCKWVGSAQLHALCLSSACRNRFVTDGQF